MRVLLVLALAALVGAAPPPRAPAADAPLTPEQRTELAKRCDEIEERATELFRTKKYDECIRLMEESVAVADRMFPAAEFPNGHPRRVGSLIRLALVNSEAGYRDAAVRHLTRAAREADRQARAEPNARTFQALDDIAKLLEAQGEYAAAAESHLAATRAAAVLVKKDGFTDHWLLADRTMSAGILLYNAGEPGRARPYYEQGLAMMLRVYPPEEHPKIYDDKDEVERGHDLMATMRNNMGFLLSEMGEPEEALPHLEAALAIRRKLYPNGNAATVTTLGNIGMAAVALDRYEEGRKALEEGVALAEKFHGKSDEALGVAYSRLGFALHRAGSFDQARVQYEKALAVRKALPAGPDRDLRVRTSLNNLGFLAVGTKQFDVARTHYDEALRLAQSLYPADQFPHGSPDLGRAWVNLGDLDLRTGETRRGVERVLTGLAMFRRYVGSVAESEAETVALGLAEIYPRADGVLAGARGRPEFDAAVYPEVWFGKSLVTRVMARRHAAALATASPDARAAWNKLQAARGRLSAAIAEPNGRPGRAERVKGLTAEKEQLERALTALLPAAGPADGGDPDALAKALPKGAAFLDVVRYVDWTEVEWKPQSRASLAKAPRRYAAFVLAPGGKPARVELGDAKPIDEAVRGWRAAAGLQGERGLINTRAALTAAVGGAAEALDPKALRGLRPVTEVSTEEALTAAGAELRRLLWEPLAKALPPGTETVYYCPDGELARLPWEALPGAKPGTVLLEEFAFARVPHGPFLLRELTRPKPAGSGALFAVGGVDYGSPPAGTFRRWSSLPGTARELDLLAGVADPKRLSAERGKGPTVDRVRQGLAGATIAHISTHGYFAADGLRTDLPGARGGAGPGESAPARRARNPLAYCGLVLAGANAPDADAILTGEAIVDLPLEPLELVVLSACETGLGDLSSPEGAFGLPRAFHLAGCRNVVASLWPVDDEASAAVMAVFYHRLLVGKEPPLAALRGAQLAVFRYPELIPELSGARGPAARTAALTKTAAAKPPGGPRAAVALWAAFHLSGAGR